MADYIKSVWEIKHGTTVLLAFGDLLEADPGMGWQKQVQVEPLLRGDEPFIEDRGNVQNNLAWTRAVHKPSMEAAREWRLSHAIECAALSKGNVTISIQGGASYTLTNAVVSTGSSASGIEVGGKPTMVVMNYEIIGGLLEAL